MVNLRTTHIPLYAMHKPGNFLDYLARAILLLFACGGLLPAACAQSAYLPEDVSTNPAHAFSTYIPVVIKTAPPSFYVAPEGNDNNPGTLAAPWRTIQKAAVTATPGSTVYARQGIYNELVSVQVSGSQEAGYITFRNYPGETPVLDGSGLPISPEGSAAFSIVDRGYIIVQGFEIRNYRTSGKDLVPMGISIRGSAFHIQIRDNRIHHIETNYPGSEGGDAHGIAVYGTSATDAIRDLVIDGNELFSLKLGSSEALVLNGNVTGFQITRNRVHDSNNIAIDLIGFEGTAPDPAVDQARDGVVSENTVYNIDSYGNPAYGTERSADGIYVDGGRNIVIERNTVFAADIGIEIASEHAGRATSAIIVRNNLVYRNLVAGLAMGGYDTQRGSTENCQVLNNTFYQNDTLATGSGELMLQYNTRENVIKNNIFNAGGQNVFLSNPFAQNSNNVLDYNLYYSPGGSEDGTWEWKTASYDTFNSYRTHTGNDLHSQFANPLFLNTGGLNFHLGSGSPAIDRGETLPDVGALDIDNQPRIHNVVDIGADEAQ